MLTKQYGTTKKMVILLNLFLYDENKETNLKK